jgi:DNA-directed RNA polymerase specialized sigma24 family protein
VLSQRWTAYDVEDVEGLCGKVLDNRLRRWGAVLNEQDSEEAMSYLIARAWELQCKFDPWHEATHRRSFSTFLYRRLRFAVVDWFRLRHGDRRYQDGDIIVLSLDHDADGSLSELVDLVAGQQGDVADDRSPDLARILTG